MTAYGSLCWPQGGRLSQVSCFNYVVRLILYFKKEVEIHLGRKQQTKGPILYPLTFCSKLSILGDIQMLFIVSDLVYRRGNWKISTQDSIYFHMSSKKLHLFQKLQGGETFTWSSKRNSPVCRVQITATENCHTQVQTSTTQTIKREKYSLSSENLQWHPSFY